MYGRGLGRVRIRVGRDDLRHDSAVELGVVRPAPELEVEIEVPAPAYRKYEHDGVRPPSYCA